MDFFFFFNFQPESCEVKLVSKLTELLQSVENVETVLKDTTKKAKAKLLKEWTNFKIGYVMKSKKYFIVIS